MKFIITLTGLFAVIASGIGVYILIQKQQKPEYTLDKDDFTVTIKFDGNGIWEYTVKGQVPTPCHNVDLLTDPIDNDKMEILVYVNPPLPDEFCAQVIHDIELAGKFEGKKTDKFQLEIVENDTLDKPGDTLNEIPVSYFDDPDLVLTEQGYTATFAYMEENLWGYVIEGTLPNPCYGSEAEAIIAESFPEQVTLKLKINMPEEDIVCTQVLQDLQLTGEFSASKEATIQFTLETN